jgi:transposase
MRFVPVKSPEPQAVLALHRTRDLLVKQRTQAVNMLRGLLAEFGLDLARGIHHALALAHRIIEGRTPDVPPLLVRIITSLAEQVHDLQGKLTLIDKELLACHRESELAQRLSSIPGIGVVTASALAASVPDPQQFRSGRQFAAWLGLTPLQHSSGGKERLGKISKMGDKYLRRLLVVGMTALVRYAKRKPEAASPWLLALLARKPARVVTVALANKAARVAWALMVRGGVYRTAPAMATAA